MATSPETHPAAPTVPPAEREVRVYSHSALYYWWPVWAVGFLMSALTWADGGRMVVVPPNTETVRDARVVYSKQEGVQTTLDSRDALVLPQGKAVPQAGDENTSMRMLHMARNKNFGVLYAVVLLIIILVSNVPLRGLWSLLIILGVILFVVIMILAGWWDSLVQNFNLIDIRINMGGYLFISTVLFVIWAVTVFIFDHRTYLIITSGQVRLCLAVGAGETVYDTTGMTFQKRQDDLFRHWIVGLGSGDLIMHRTNTNQEIDFPNVLFIGAKIREIERLMKEREVV